MARAVGIDLGTTNSVVAIMDGKEPKVHQVRVGLADDRYTELASGDLKEGDAVIVKSHTELKK